MKIEELKQKLEKYKTWQIKFSEHAEIVMIEREVDRSIIIENLLNPKKLIDFEKVFDQERKIFRYVLYFDMPHDKTLILPVVVGKDLYIITVILRYRKWRKIIHQ